MILVIAKTKTWKIHTRLTRLIVADGVLVNNGWAGAIGTAINCVGMTDGGATDDSVNEIGVGVGIGRSTISDFSNVPFRLIDRGGGTSSTWCILYEQNKYLEMNRII